MAANMNLPIWQLFGFQPTPVSSTLLDKVDMLLSKYAPTIPISDGTLVGLEIEVENVPKWHELGVWSPKEDGSLRNHGVEYISPPLPASTIEQALTHLFRDVLPNNHEFTKRTSIHVHMNARDMTGNQILSFLYLYLVFERSLYRYVERDRSKNIFCIPLYDTDMVHSFDEMAFRGIDRIKWMKYCGLNLLPLYNLGSIEFRHLHGTNNIPYITTWVGLITKLKKAAMFYDLETLKQDIIALNTNSAYYDFAVRIFSEFSGVILEDRAFRKEMELGVTLVKRDIISSPLEQVLRSHYALTSEASKLLSWRPKRITNIIPLGFPYQINVEDIPDADEDDEDVPVEVPQPEWPSAIFSTTTTTGTF